MIITQKKPIDELMAMLGDAQKIAILGCGSCATACATGGEKEVAELKAYLESKGKTVVATNMADYCCMNMGVKTAMKKLNAAGPDAVVCMSCGDGVQVAAAHSPSAPVYPSNNTMFLGEAVRFGLFEEACHLCGDCVLGTTGGICPISRCAKSLVNGPCGGQKNGKCDSSLCGGRKNREQFRKISPRKKSIGRDNVRRRRHRSSRRPYYSISCSNSVNRFDAKNS